VTRALGTQAAAGDGVREAVAASRIARMRPPSHGRRSIFVALAVGLVGAVGATRAERAIAEPTIEQDKQIKKAIEKGGGWLRMQRNADGSYNPLDFDGKPQYELGMTCLCGLALLACGDDPNDAGMKAVYEYVKAKEAAEAGGRTTYSTSLTLMFVTEYHRPRHRGDAKYAPKKKPCTLPKDVETWVQDMANWLMSVQLEEGWWRYPQAPPGDLSNTQYALLGLRAARDCGVDVPAKTYLRALENCLAKQEVDGPKIKRISPALKPGEREYASDSGDKARGWNYQGTDGTLVTGAMTTAAIAVLAICRDALKNPTRSPDYADALDRKVARSVQDGFAWVDHHWSVTYNPPRGAPAWHYYYLYGLERACAFAGREHVGKHDWFVEGAMVLTKDQKEDGRWSTAESGLKEIVPNDLADTAWALLFLNKATRPLEPIRPPVVTSGG
jgi:hypothetical protein